MKKLFVLLLILICSSGLIFAQESSQMSVLTDGLFRTELDGAFDPVTAKPGPVFGDLGGEFFFSGLTNFPDLDVLNNSYDPAPFTLGYYSEEEEPFSVMAGIDINVDNAGISNGLTIPGGGTSTKPVNADTVDWVDRTNDTNARLSAWEIELSPYYLAQFGDMNVAFDVYAAFNEWIDTVAFGTASAWAQANSTVVESNYYDSTPAADVVPTPALDYTYTVTQTAPDNSVTITAAVPIYMPAGDTEGTYVRPYLSFSSRNESITYTEAYSAPAQTGAGTFAIIENDDIKDVTSSLSGGASFEKYSAGYGEHEDNRFIIYGAVNLTYGLPGNLVDEYYEVNYDYAGDGADLVLSDIATWTTDTTTRKGLLSGNISAGASNSYYYDLAPGVTAGFRPGADLTVTYGSSDSTYYDSQLVEVTRTDGAGGDGEIDSVDDTIDTVTTVYRDNTDGLNLDTDLVLTLPGALSYTPDGGRFTVYVSGTPRASFSLDINSDVSTSTVVTTAQTDGTGAETAATTVDTGAEGVRSGSVLPGFNFDMTTGAGFRFLITENGSIDVSLDSDTTGTRLSAEAVFSLP